MAERSDGANLWSTQLSAQMGPTDLDAQVDTTAGGPTSPAWMVIETETQGNREVVYFDGTFDGTTFRVASLSSRYQDGSAAGSGLTHPIDATVISSPLWSQLDDVWDYIEAHEAATNVHGAVSTATANTIVRRDASSRFRAGSPSNSADVATKGYVDGVVPIGAIILWSGSVGSIPSNWALCNGSNGTPDLRGRFVIGAGGAYNPSDTGGATSHTHSGGSHSHSAGSHTHSFSDTTSTHAGHSHDVNVSTDTSNRGIAGGGEIVSPASHDHGNTDSAGSHSHTVSGTSASGGGGSTGTTAAATGSASTLPVYYALAYIMRTS